MSSQGQLWRWLVTGYVFWTNFSALPPMIWFYPLNELEITGYEVFVLALFAPIILKLKFILKFFQSKLGDIFLQLSTILCLLSFQAPDTFWRLCIIAVAAGLSVVKFACDFSQPDHSKKSLALFGYSAGYVALLVTRIMCRTVTPAFSDFLPNIAVVSVAFVSFISGVYGSFRKPNKSETKQNSNNYPRSWAVGLGLGCVVYIVLGIFGEVSVPCRWSVSPYPSPGPLPTPWGLVVLACLILGLCLSSVKCLVYHPLWSIIGLLSYTFMYNSDRYQGFFGSCVLAIYIMSVWPTYASLFSVCKEPGVVLSLAMFACLLPAFYSVWTVAYNFVPLGVYTREFTGLSIGVTMFFAGLGLFLHRNYNLPVSKETLSLSSWKCVKIWLILFGLGSASMAHRYNQWRPGDVTKAADHNDVTAMIWTYHFGYDNEGWPSLDRTVKLIRDIDADVVGLLETDASRLYMGNNDLAAWLAENLNMYVDYGPATKKHTWGSMLLSKFPIVYSEHHLLPSPHGELAPAISALLDVRGSRLGVVVTHMGNDRDDLDRKLQTLSLSNITSTFVEKGFPVIFLGYVTSKPYERDYKVFTSNGRMKDIDPTDRSRFCEYIYYQGLTRLAYARIAKGRLSDTEIQTAKFRIPSVGEPFEDFSTVTTDLQQVPANQRYSQVFGEYRVGHYYGSDHKFHMSTPKYFLP